jgi:short-subunit dehydrogenase
LSESIAHELEPFGIKVILIEPGAIGSNFMKGSVLPKRALDPESPYSEFVQKVRHKIGSDHENATQPEEVAKAILKAITSDNPDFRYSVGKDAAMMLETRGSMSDREFQDLITQQFNLQNIS